VASAGVIALDVSVSVPVLTLYPSAASQARLLNAFTSQPAYNDAAANADFALVTLAQPVGDAAGWMGFEYPADGPQTVDLTTAGEPSSSSWKISRCIADELSQALCSILYPQRLGLLPSA